MASVREELIEELINQYDCSAKEATDAVDKAIEADTKFMDDSIENVAEYIYSEQKYWE